MAALSNLAPLPGRVLVAAPALGDPNFVRTVILVCRHDSESGSFGFVLNRCLSIPLGKAAPDLGEDRKEPLWIGGPVEPRMLWILHRRNDLEGAGEVVVPGLRFTADPTVIRRVVRTNAPDPDAELMRLFAGYAGWGPGQLDAEIEEGSWSVIAASPATVFAGDPLSLWRGLWTRANLPGRDDPEVHRRAALN